MKKNMGLTDRVIRLLIAIFLIDVAVNSSVNGPLTIVFWVIAGVMLLTSVTARCPLYTALKIHTDSRSKTNL